MQFDVGLVPISTGEIPSCFGTVLSLNVRAGHKRCAESVLTNASNLLIVKSGTRIIEVSRKKKLLIAQHIAELLDPNKSINIDKAKYRRTK
jgi:hypothetical protein